jgi:26S proteasome non-ATPase regulatory subunit 10
MLTREAVSEGHGDAALHLLREGADSEKKDLDGRLAIDTAPDLKVRLQSVFRPR